MTGVVANQDSYMKGRVAQRDFATRLGSAFDSAFEEWGELTGRTYGSIQPYRTEDAEFVLVAMGSTADTVTSVVDHLRRQGRRVGAVTLTVFRPFPAEALALAVAGATAVAVVERTDEPLAGDNPVARELKSALADVAGAGARIPRVVGASAGLGSRDVTAGDLVAVFDWLADPAALDATPRAVIGIHHPDALVAEPLELRPAGAYSLRGHSIGGFGSVTTNRLVATVVSDLFDRYVQAYPRYGSEKKGLPTTYYLTIATEPIRQHAELRQVEFVPIHAASAFRHGSPLAGLVDGGTLFMQTPLTDPEEIWTSIPPAARTEILERRINVAALDTAGLARAHAPRPDLEVRMQGVALVGVFLRLAPFAAEAGLDREALLEGVRARLGRFFGKRGSSVVEANLAVVAAAYDGVIDVTQALAERMSTSPVPQLEATEPVPLLEEAIR
jgi:pyruvate-ferredoxin/flavodoxin oxidoreductase